MIKEASSKRLSREVVVLVILAGILVIGILIGVLRHSARSEIKLEATSHAPMRISLNQATAEDLSRLPGIGPELASRIILYRKEHGDFLHTDSLLNVPGIGETKLREIKPYLEVP
ncbi:MAG: helix-hairpin-helix domain-containing protein [candidate division WOR-3 bacterium]|nr:helix-hairpin-helix domain-containing protein [candidate division WOR-3 bacterium]